VNPQQLTSKLRPHLGINVRQRLVKEHDSRLSNERPGERRPLLLPTADLAWVLHAQPFQTSEGQVLVGNTTGVAGSLPADPQWERNVVLKGHVGPQGVRLEHHVQIAPVGWHVNICGAIEHDVLLQADPPLIWPFKAGDTPEQRRLSAATWAKQDYDLARKYI
jgi:hypothetical protein